MNEISKPWAFLLSASLSLVSILLCLLVSEIYLANRYHQERSRIEAKQGGGELCTMASEFPELIYTLVPGKCGANSQGFRDYEYAYSKGGGVFRIVVIGDSVAAGQGVEIQDGFGKVLEKKLNSAVTGQVHKVEVIVLAQSGYSTSQELFLLQHDAVRYAPDLILWTYVLNDPAHPVYHNSNGELGLYYFKPRWHTVNFISRKLFEIREFQNKERCEAEYHALLHCVYWKQVESNVARIAQLSKQIGIPIIFVIHPLLEDIGDFNQYSLAPVHAKLGAAAAAAGLPVVDLLNAYKPHAPRDLTQSYTQWHDPWHPNAKGHRIAADYLYSAITGSQYFPHGSSKKE